MLFTLTHCLNSRLHLDHNPDNFDYFEVRNSTGESNCSLASYLGLFSPGVGRRGKGNSNNGQYQTGSRNPPLLVKLFKQEINDNHYENYKVSNLFHVEKTMWKLATGFSVEFLCRKLGIAVHISLPS